jgi:hypothetical protein
MVERHLHLKKNRMFPVCSWPDEECNLFDNPEARGRPVAAAPARAVRVTATWLRAGFPGGLAGQESNFKKKTKIMPTNLY